MQELEETQRQPASPALPISEALKTLANTESEPLSPEEADEIFLNAIAEIPTQPLDRHYRPQWVIDRKIERECLFALLLFSVSLAATVVVRIINQPIITVTLLPVHQSIALTTTIPVPIRTLAPVTLTKTLTAPTTGHGHQDATRATGTLTFYNGLFSVQTIAQGSVFTGADGVKVVIDQAVTIPPNHPPADGQATSNASALNPGAAGNIQAGDIHTALSQGVLVTNSHFTGGRDARDYQAVAKHDLDTLTAQVQEQLTEAMPQAFTRRPDETVQTTHCSTRIHPDYGIGEEAPTLHVSASQTCGAIAYRQDELTKKAARVFNATRPGRPFEFVGHVRTTVMSVSPFTVRVSGQWEYAFTSDDEQFLAEHIQGETPAQARAYLLKTGLVSRVTITPTQSLPDLYHIKFLILIGV